MVLSGWKLRKAVGKLPGEEGRGATCNGISLQGTALATAGQAGISRHVSAAQHDRRGCDTAHPCPGMGLMLLPQEPSSAQGSASSEVAVQISSTLALSGGATCKPLFMLSQRR